jgi:hypothetical protein
MNVTPYFPKTWLPNNYFLMTQMRKIWQWCISLGIRIVFRRWPITTPLKSAKRVQRSI